VGLRRRGGRRRRRGPGGARSMPCGVAKRSCSGSGPLPRAWAQLPVDCVLLLGRVAGAAAAGLRRMPRSLWGPAIGGRPHQRPPRRGGGRSHCQPALHTYCVIFIENVAREYVVLGASVNSMHCTNGIDT
jgi:hypothetical protein